MIDRQDSVIAVLLSKVILVSTVAPAYAHSGLRAVDDVDESAIDGAADSQTSDDASPSFIRSSVATDENTSVEPVGNHSERMPDWLRTGGYTIANGTPVNSSSTAAEHREEAIELLAELASKGTESPESSGENGTVTNETGTDSANGGEGGSSRSTQNKKSGNSAGDGSDTSAGGSEKGGAEETETGTDSTSSGNSSGSSGTDSGTSGTDSGSSGTDSGPPGNSGNGSTSGNGQGSASFKWAWGGMSGGAFEFIYSNKTGADGATESPSIRRNGGAESSGGSAAGGPNAGSLSEELNKTTQWTVDDYRTDNASIFETDRMVSARSQGRYSEVAEHLAAADRLHSAAAISDAERAHELLSERDFEYDGEAVEAALADARRAHERGQTLEDRGFPVAAINQYHEAWLHAQRALDIMDEAVEPVVWVETRDDMPRSEQSEYRVRGIVFDVRPNQRTLNLTINGKKREVELNASTAPATDARFNTTVEIGPQTPENDRVYAINLTANDPGTEYATTGDRDIYESIRSPQSGTDVLKLDGDGLPGWYEEEIVGTDPLAPDSNSTATAANESDAGKLDGLKDFDDDGLITFEESNLLVDPLASDTDGDDLRDGFEVGKAGTDPLDRDTTGDGVMDPEMDLSGDGLTLIEEQKHGTNPLVPDTDSDGLTDFEEVHEYGTEPLKADTDGDGLLDGEELRVETDPVQNDTDGDGVLDGNETYTTTASNEETGVEVDVTGEGVAASGVTIRADESEREEEYLVGKSVHITNTSNVEKAEVTIPLTVDLSENERDEVAIYKWDPQSDDRWQRVETEIDLENDTASATVESFSYFGVMRTDWEDSWTDTASPGWPELETFDDLQGWKTSGDTGVKDEVAVVGEDVGVSSFGLGTQSGRFEGPGGGGSGGDDCPTSSGIGIQSGYVDVGDGGGSDSCPDDDDGSGGGGSGDDGSSGDEENDEPDRAKLTRTVDLSDVEGDVDLYLRVKSEEPGENARAFITVDGESVYEGNRHKSGAWITIEGKDISEYAGEEVTVELRTLGDASLEVEYIGFVKDSAGSGIADVAERMDLTMTSGPSGVRGQPLDLDPALADTSGDGLKDGQQVDIGVSVVPARDGWQIQGVVQETRAHPARFDTDGDELSDNEELKVWNTDPFDRDTSGDGYIDSVSPDPNEDFSPPVVQIMKAEDYAGDIEIKVMDGSEIESVHLVAHEDRKVRDDAKKVGKVELVDTKEVDGKVVKTYRAKVPRFGYLKRPPDYYFVNASDVNDVRTSLRIQPEDDRIAQIDKLDAKVAIAGVPAAAPAGSTVAGGSEAVGSTVFGAVLLVGGSVVAIHDYNRPAESFEEDNVLDQKKRVVPPSNVQYGPWDVPGEELTVNLPSGAVYEGESPIGDTYQRGYGWKYINELGLPGIHSPSDIGQVIKQPNAIEQGGKYTLVIGDNPNTNGEIGILIQAGSVVIVNEFVRDPQNRKVEIDRHDEHPIRDGHLRDHDEVKKIIENPDQIYQVGRDVHYIKQVDGEWKVVRTRFVGTHWTVSTGYPIGESKEEVIKYLSRWDITENNRVYGPPLSE